VLFQYEREIEKYREESESERKIERVKDRKSEGERVKE
jgi:hypothetical protein